MLTIEDEAAGWCASYVEAFISLDASRIADHWAFPALISQGERNITFKTRDAFDENTRALIDFYCRRNVTGATRKLLKAFSMSDETAAIRVEDTLVNRAGETFVRWDAAYVLRRMKDGWRAVFAVADGEIAAWEALGIPLGSGD